jgi:hypothetical protein
MYKILALYNVDESMADFTSYLHVGPERGYRCIDPLSPSLYAAVLSRFSCQYGCPAGVYQCWSRELPNGHVALGLPTISSAVAVGCTQSCSRLLRSVWSLVRAAPNPHSLTAVWVTSATHAPLQPLRVADDMRWSGSPAEPAGLMSQFLVMSLIILLLCACVPGHLHRGQQHPNILCWMSRARHCTDPSNQINRQSYENSKLPFKGASSDCIFNYRLVHSLSMSYFWSQRLKLLHNVRSLALLGKFHESLYRLIEALCYKTEGRSF